LWWLSLAEKNQNAEGYNNRQMSGNHLSDDNNRFLGPRAAAKRNPNKKRQTKQRDKDPHAGVEVVAEKKNSSDEPSYLRSPLK
jgi:hypothetical protein